VIICSGTLNVCHHQKKHCIMHSNADNVDNDASISQKIMTYISLMLLLWKNIFLSVRFEHGKTYQRRTVEGCGINPQYLYRITFFHIMSFPLLECHIFFPFPCSLIIAVISERKLSELLIHDYGVWDRSEKEKEIFA